MPEIKGQCDQCKQNLIFPSEHIGQATSCPHCFSPTVLRPFSLARPTGGISHGPNGKDTTGMMLRILVILAVAAVIAFVAMRKIEYFGVILENNQHILDNEYANAMEAVKIKQLADSQTKKYSSYINNTNISPAQNAAGVVSLCRSGHTNRRPTNGTKSALWLW